MKQTFESTIHGIEGSKPIFLNQSETVFIVDVGRLDIFSVPIENGIRNYLFRCNQGDVVFGLDMDQINHKIHLIAVGTPETIIEPRKLDHLKDLAQIPEIAKNMADLIENWVHGLTTGIMTQLAPTRFKPILNNQDLVLEPGDIARSDQHVLWIKCYHGALLFMGKTHLPIDNDYYFPLSPNAWITTTEKTHLNAITTANYFQQEPRWCSLNAFHTLLLQCIYYDSIAFQNKEYQRFQNKMISLTRQKSIAYSSFVDVLSHGKKQQFSQQIIKNHLFSVCQIIGKEMNTPFQFPNYPSQTIKEQLEAIANLSGLRIRFVPLKDNWWQNDHGPLIGFLKQNQTPVALIPSKNGSYDIVDPGQGKLIHMRQKHSDLLASYCYKFYRTFKEKPIYSMDLIKFSVNGCQKDILSVLVTGLAGACLGLMPPIITGIIIDSIIPEASRFQLTQACLILIACAVSISLFRITRYIAVLRIESKISTSNQAALWDRLITLPIPFFRQFSSGDLADRSMGIETMRKIISGLTVQSLLAGLFSSTNLILLYVYDTGLATVAVILTLIGISITAITAYIQIQYQRQANQIQGKLTGLVFQFIRSISRLKVSGAEDRAFALWANLFAQKTQITMKASTIRNYQNTVTAFLSVITLCIIFLLVGLKMKTELSTGSFIAFLAALTSFQAALIEMTTAITSVIQVVPIFERLQPILKTVPEIDSSRRFPIKIEGYIEVSHLKFRYSLDSPLIINDVSFQVQPGEFIAIVGPSGSGKSTLLRLLLGFESPESGTIFYDGHDLWTLDIHALRKQIGTVLQNGSIMSGTIGENILGMNDLNISDAWEAAKLAGFDQDIEKMPMGMNTMLNEGGTTLSGGQRQRVFIARAIINKPRVLLFDEATSALDNKTQAHAIHNIEKLRSTRIVIAHRLSTIKGADRILVMDKGKLVQQGTYDMLMASDGLFKTLSSRQII